MNELYLIALANAAFCITCIVILVCRLNAMGGKNIKMSVKVAHAVGVGAMVCSMFRPMINEWPGYASLLVDIYVLAELWASGSAWRGDKPPLSATVHAPLENQEWT